MSAPLETTGLGKAFRGHWALRACSMRLVPGSITALVGPNGSGKSTLLQLAAGLLTPTEGEVRVFGGAPARDAETLGRVGYLAQDHPLYATFTVADLLRMGRDMNPRWDDGVALGYLDGLGIPLRKRAGALSGGQKSQVSLALTLAKRPDLLLLDEPVASLDPLARHDFMSVVLQDAADRGTTVVLSSHVVSELERLSDHLVVLGRGHIQVDGPVDDLLMRHAVLTGPTDAADPPEVRQVVERRSSGRASVVVAELTAPLRDPRWQMSPLTLEELVLAYLREPDAGTRSTPLTALGGAR